MWRIALRRRNITLMGHLVLLCRHVTRADEAALHAARSRSRTDDPAELVAVSEQLSETLARERAQLIAIRHAPSAVATTHARWLRRKLDEHVAPAGFSMKIDCRLDPARSGSWRGTGPADRLCRRFVDLVDRAHEGTPCPRRAVLIIGHMPQLSWLATSLAGNRPWRMRIVDGYLPPFAFRNGEVAAIALTGTRRNRPQGHLDWTVAPDDTRAIEELRDKIKSKMEVAKLLGGFMTLVLGGVVLAPDRLDALASGGDRWAVYAAATLFLIAIGLYLRTMYAYDALLMPTRFWAEAAPGTRVPRWLVRRPPSSAAWILYQNMLYVWTYLFTPATFAVLFGLLALAYAALDPGWIPGVFVALGLALATSYALRHGPVLGSQD